MLAKFNILSFTLLSILLFEGYQGIQINNLEAQADKIFKHEESQNNISKVEFDLFKQKLAEKKSFDKDTFQIEYIEKLVNSSNSNINDYSQASLLLSELIYSDKYLNLQQRFDTKNLYDVDNSKLSDNEKNYKKLLSINNTLDEKFKISLTKYQTSDIPNILKKYNKMYSYTKRWSMSDFIAINKKYEQKLDEYKTQYLLSSPDYFEQVVEHFKTHKSLSKQDYYSILKSSFDKKEAK